MSKFLGFIGIIAFAGFGFGGYLAIASGDEHLFYSSFVLYLLGAWCIVFKDNFEGSRHE